MLAPPKTRSKPDSKPDSKPQVIFLSKHFSGSKQAAVPPRLGLGCLVCLAVLVCEDNQGSNRTSKLPASTCFVGKYGGLSKPKVRSPAATSLIKGKEIVATIEDDQRLSIDEDEEQPILRGLSALREMEGECETVAWTHRKCSPTCLGRGVPA